MESYQVKLNLLGTSLSFATSEKKEYMDRVIASLDLHIKKIEKRFPTVEPLKIALLANLFLMDELLREYGRNGDANRREMNQNIEVITSRIIENIDTTLKEF